MNCAHDGCVCQVSGDEFCSDYCAGHRSQAEEMCDCGHRECELHQEKRRKSPGRN